MTPPLPQQEPPSSPEPQRATPEPIATNLQEPAVDQNITPGDEFPPDTPPPGDTPEEEDPTPLYSRILQLAEKVRCIEQTSKGEAFQEAPPSVRGQHDCALAYMLHFADKQGTVFKHEGSIPLVGMTLPASLPTAYRTFEAVLSTIILTPLNAALLDYAQSKLEHAPRQAPPNEQNFLMPGDPDI